MKRFASTWTNSDQGQSLVELALMIPLLFLLIVNAVNFGAFFFAWITVANAARAGAQYMTAAAATMGMPAPATFAQVSQLVSDEISSLPNRASLLVGMCTNQAGVTTCSGVYTATLPADPESSSYVRAGIEVRYTYLPLIPAFHFPAMGVHLTLPPTMVRQRATMRMLQ